MTARTLSLHVLLVVLLAGGRVALTQQSSTAPAKPAFPPNDPVTRAMTAVDNKGGGDETGPYDLRPKPGANRDQLVGAPVPLTAHK